MVDMTQPQPTETLSDVVARRIQEIRKRRDMSAAELAEACAKVGFPQLTASVIANIESGRRGPDGRRRRDVTVDEVYAFAQALRVGVTKLLPAPPGRSEDMWQLADRLEEHAAIIDQERIELAKQMEEGIRKLDLDAEHARMARELLERSDLTDLERIARKFREVVLHQLDVREATVPDEVSRHLGPDESVKREAAKRQRGDISDVVLFLVEASLSMTPSTVLYDSGMAWASEAVEHASKEHRATSGAPSFSEFMRLVELARQDTEVRADLERADATITEAARELHALSSDDPARHDAELALGKAINQLLSLSTELMSLDTMGAAGLRATRSGERETSRVFLRLNYEDRGSDEYTINPIRQERAGLTERDSWPDRDDR
jgi:transcriptional regulator with XRE-family HTH domain